MKIVLYIMLILGILVGSAYTYDCVYKELQHVISADEDAKQQQIDILLTREQELRLELSLMQEQLKILQEENKKLELQLQIELAKSDLELSQGQRAILEASAKTVDTNRWLVAWDAIRADVILIIVLVLLVTLAVIGFTFGISIYIRLKRRNTKMDIILPVYKVR